MDYKNTLNLPRTDFPMKADLVAREPQRLEKWRAGRLYEKIQAARVNAEKFILHDGPPFANGEVHIGNALNKILKDFVVKYHTLRGKSAPYVPGWDCHGLPIEFKVSQEMRKAGNTNADPVTIRKACEAYARKYIDLQRRQFQRLGILGEWDHPYLTLNKEYEADELRLFADIVERGFVYRGKKPVYWSIPCRTALAEAEVEYQDHVSQSVFVKFPILEFHKTSLLIWTTTPWTLPANLAVAYNSTFDYTMVQVGDEAYIVSAGLLPQVAAKCGWKDYQIVRPVYGDQLSSLRYEHPFAQRTGPLLTGDAFVDNTAGTGLVHIAPGHGLEDYQLGLQHDLPIYSPVDDDGRFTHTNDLPVQMQMPGSLLGQAILEKNGRSEANEAVLALLRERNRLAHQEDYTHSYPHCWRSKTPVIFRAMDQWFIKIDHVVPVAANVSSRKDSSEPVAPAGPDAAGVLTNAATKEVKTFREGVLSAINGVNWIPEWGKNRIEAAVKSRPDWCISRQRSWGVPLPFFYDAKGCPSPDPAKDCATAAQVVRHVADLISHHGSNVWFEKSCADLWAAVKPENWNGPAPVAKSSDTLDVWIDSGSSSRAVLMQREELRRGALGVPASAGPGAAGTDGMPPEGGTPNPWQADMYLEGSDQHRGWFQSSLLLSLAGNGVAPYKTVLTHGFMVDADREKISKSKQGQGGYDKPQNSEAYIKKYGADIIRLWVASQDFRNDTIVSEERLNKVAESYRVIRNALRYQLSNLYDFDPAKHAVPKIELTGLDMWILHEFHKQQKEIAKAYDAYEFHTVYQNISQFAAVELSAIYHDLIKDGLYTDPCNSKRRRSIQTTLYILARGLCLMLAPILAFTTDEAWEFLPGGSKVASVFLSNWDITEAEIVAEAEREVFEMIWKTNFELRKQVLAELERARQAKSIGKSLEAKVSIPREETALAQWAERHKEVLREFLNVSQIEFRSVNGPTKSDQPISVSHADGRKCARCWHWETDVGTHPEHPTICGRCVEAIAAIKMG